MGLGSFTIVTGLLVTAALYIITCLSFYFVIRKAGYRNKWMAFVPMLSIYKQLCFVYDYFKADQVLNGTMPAVKYQDVRRNFVSSATVAYVIMLFTGAFLFLLLMEFNMLGIESSALDMITTAASIIAQAAVCFFMLRSVINKETGESISPLMAFLLAVLGIVTIGFSWIAVYFFLGLFDKHYSAIRFDD